MPKSKSRLLNKRIVFFIALFIIWETLYILHSSSIIHIPGYIMTSYRLIFITIITFLVISVIIRVTAKRIYSVFTEDVELEQRLFFGKLYQIFLYFLGIMFVLYHAGVSLSNITLFIGLVTTGLALALQNVLLGIVAWMILLTKKPFRIGDHIRIGDDEGRVVHIGTFFVTLDVEWAQRKKMIKIPNKTFVDKSVFNFGDKGIRDRVTLQITALPRHVEQRISAMAAEVKRHIPQSEEVSVTLDSEGGNLFFVIDYFVDINKRQKTKTTVIARLYEMNRDIVKK